MVNHAVLYGLITSEKYEAKLDDEGIESPLGDIPYHENDSYIEDEKK